MLSLSTTTWSESWKAAGYYSLAEIACMRGDMSAAMDFVERSLEANSLNIRALNFKAALLRRTGRTKEALDVLDSAMHKTDPLDVRTMTERWLATKKPADGRILLSTLRDHPAAGLETATEYADAGLWEEGTEVLLQMIAAAADKAKISPMVYYYLGYFAEKSGREKKALKYFRLAEKMPPDYVFPFQWEAIGVLQEAMKRNPGDARAPYYLGNLLFDWQPERAREFWEKSAALDPSLPIVHRNLAVAYSHLTKENLGDKAIAEMEKAISAGSEYPIHFFELDQLYETAGTPPEKRLAMLEKHHNAVSQRDDALSREISLKIFMGKYDEAVELMKDHQFNNWEGGSRFNVYDCWTDAHLLRGRLRFGAGQYRDALADYQISLELPENLRAERREGSTRNAEVAYWIGTAYEALGEQNKANENWNESASAEGPRMRRGFGGVFLSERGAQRYYQALSMRRLGQEEKAVAIFQELVKSGTEALGQNSAEIDFFSAFGERQSQRARTAMAHYITGLGYLGMGETQKAKQEFTEALKANPGHLGAKTALVGLE
jgi:tetratricopeptide (TPR) repeat protein